MCPGMETERTPLFIEDSGEDRTLTVVRITKFQCCLMSTLVPLFVVFLVVSVSVITNHHSQSNPPAPELLLEAVDSTQTDELQTTEKKATVWTTLPAAIVSGEVYGSQSRGSVLELWDGNFPVTFHLSPTTTHVINWSGTFTKNTKKGHGAIVRGTYSYKTWTGRFSLAVFYAMPLRIQDKLLPSSTYSSTVIFKDAEAQSTDIDAKTFTNGITIILMGTVSPDRSMFYWNGRLGLVIPSDI